MSMLVLNPKPQTLNPTIMASGTGTRTTGEVAGAADGRLGCSGDAVLVEALGW